MAQVSAMKFVKEVDASIRCPECGSRNIICDPKSGEYVCGDCGLVIQDFMPDRGPEWRSFTPEEKMLRSRVGMPTSYAIHDKGLSTTIEDYEGLKAKEKYRAKRLKRTQIMSSVINSEERNLYRAGRIASRIFERVQLPSHVKEE